MLTIRHDMNVSRSRKFCATAVLCSSTDASGTERTRSDTTERSAFFCCLRASSSALMMAKKTAARMFHD